MVCWDSPMRWGKNLRGLRISEIFTASTLSSCAAGLRLSNGRGAELLARRQARARAFPRALVSSRRSEEHTSELQSLMRISYAVFCLKKKKTNIHNNNQ